MGLFENKSVQRISKGLVTAAVVGMAAFLGFSDPMGAPATASFEGEVLRNYIDVVGVETWCIGETQVGRLKAGYTHDYCMSLFKKRYAEYSRELYSCYSDTAKRYVTPAMHTAFVDVFYNTGAKCKTSMMRDLDARDPVKACTDTLKYRFSGGLDCSLPANKKACGGVWDRRQKFAAVCVRDAQQLPPQGIGGDHANSSL